MTSNHKRLHVLSVYAIDVSKPLPDRKLAYDIVTEILNGMSEDDDVCIQGDFNASVLSPNNNTIILNDFIEQQQLHIMPNDLPTYIGPLSTTIIDHFVLSASLLQYITQHYVAVSPSTVTHPSSDHRVLSIRLYAANVPPPSLDTILPSSSARSSKNIYDVYKFKDEDAATQYIEAVKNAYSTQWQNKYVTNDTTSVNAIQQTLQQMTSHLKEIIHTAATSTIGFVTHHTSHRVHHRTAALIATVNHRYDRHKKQKTSQSYSRYMSAKDNLTAYVQRMADKKYNKLMNDITNAVSTIGNSN
jgi:hypothetical protein